MDELNKQFESILQKIEDLSMDHPNEAQKLYKRLMVAQTKLILHSLGVTERT